MRANQNFAKRLQYRLALPLKRSCHTQLSKALLQKRTCVNTAWVKPCPLIVTLIVYPALEKHRSEMAEGRAELCINLRRFFRFFSVWVENCQTARDRRDVGSMTVRPPNCRSEFSETARNRLRFRAVSVWSRFWAVCAHL